jgi:hypothetical protein
MVDPTDIVGHKTFRAEGGGFRHEQLTRAEADALIEQCDKNDARRKELMPDEATALNVAHDAWQRLKEMAWRETRYAPKNKPLLMVEPGSTGIHRGYRDEHGFWITDAGDLWPSHPTLFKEADNG